MVLSRRIELLLIPYQRIVLPLSLRQQDWHETEESNPLQAGLESASGPARIMLASYIGAPDRTRTYYLTLRRGTLFQMSYESVVGWEGWIRTTDLRIQSALFCR